MERNGRQEKTKKRIEPKKIESAKAAGGKKPETAMIVGVAKSFETVKKTDTSKKINSSKIIDDMPSEELLYDLADFYKVFGDTTRIKILYVLFECDMCVGDIASALNMSDSAISHQLRILKQADLVKFRRDGKIIFYSLADDHVRTIIDQGMEHICE